MARPPPTWYLMLGACDSTMKPKVHRLRALSRTWTRAQSRQKMPLFIEGDVGVNSTYGADVGYRRTILYLSSKFSPSGAYRHARRSIVVPDLLRRNGNSGAFRTERFS
jgi:hypothetical protein